MCYLLGMRARPLLAVLLFGCSATPATDAGTDAGGPCSPVAHVCVLGESGTPAVNATVTAARAAEVPFEGRTGADGCVNLDLTEGAWQVRASTESLCVSEFSEVVVPACGTVEASLTADLCAG